MLPTHIPDRPGAVTRLTALWALNECGLGGIMFALKIPFTGIFVGGFAVVLLSLIAYYSHYQYRKILRATLLVLIVKATVSPHSPPPAYLAVAFQGAAAALFFGGLRRYRPAALLLALTAMLESAGQKVIVLTLLYGNSLWLALDKLYEGIARDFRLPGGHGFSYWLLLLYLLLYLVWGLAVGLFAARLPQQLQRQEALILAGYSGTIGHTEGALPVAVRKRRRWPVFLLVLLFILLVFALGGQYRSYKLLYILLRSLAAVLLLFFVLRPLLTVLIRRWLQARRAPVRQEAGALIDKLPALRRFIRPSWQLARDRAKGIGRLRYFILSMIVFTLHEEELR